MNSESKHTHTAKLKCLWDRIGFKGTGIGPFADFVDNPDKKFLWRRYVTNESLERELFRGTDRIKLVNIMIERLIHMRNAKQNKIFHDIFAFHNKF